MISTLRFIACVTIGLLTSGYYNRYSLNENLLKEVTVKIGLERIDIQEGVIVKTLLNSSMIGLVMRKTNIKYCKSKYLL